MQISKEESAYQITHLFFFNKFIAWQQRLRLWHQAHPVCNIRPKSWLEYVSTFPWGRFGVVSIRCPMIRKWYGSRSYLDVKGLNLVIFLLKSEWSKYTIVDGFVYSLNNVHSRGVWIWTLIEILPWAMKFFSNFCKNSK